MAFVILGSPRPQFTDSNGDPLVSGTLSVLDPTDDTNKASYPTAADADAATNANANPMTLNSLGMTPTGLFGLDGESYKIIVLDEDGVTIWNHDDIQLPSAVTASSVGSAIYPATAAETSASITPTNLNRTPHPMDVRRYGIVPNDAGARAANTTALQNLLDPTVTGPVGRLIFPNISGNDTYYFDDIIQVRRGVYMNLDDSTLDFAKVYEAADDLMAFFTMIGDVSIENGAINVAYDGSAGTNAGQIIRIGSRESYPFGSFTGGLNDEDLTVPMGNIVLRNLRLSSNNPSTAMILMLGGLRGVVQENLHLDGQDAADRGIYYEFGHYHYDAVVANRTTSHASGLVFRNIFIKDLDTTTNGLSLIGCYSAIVENLEVDTANSAFVFRPGEALFYNVGAPYATGIKRGISLKNIVGQNMASNAMVLTGAESSAGGYLSTESLTESEQTDLMSFSLDGFAIDGAISVSGDCDIRNGTITDSGGSGGIIISDDCVQFDIDNVHILEGGNVGVRCLANSLWSTPRLKIGSIRNSQIAGNTGAGISLTNTRSVLVENCRIGYNTLYDPAAETTQTVGVSVGTTGQGAVCRGNYVTTSGGAVAYSSIATGDNGNSIENARGTVTTSGSWKIDGVVSYPSVNIADATHVVNTADKYVGKRVWDSSNDRELRAAGATATSDWDIVDGSASVTPS